MSKSVTLNKGVFVLSLDTELAWGTRGASKYHEAYDNTRRVITRILALCEKYRIGITWAVVGHLFLDSCRPENGVKHPEIVGRTDDWFSVDPCTDAGRAPWWYGPDIVRAIRSCPVPQELGSHSFSHLPQEPWCTAETFDSELKASAKAAGMAFKSFIFPRNQVKHLSVLEQNGFTAYRGKDWTWYARLPGPLRRIAHGLDNYFVPTAPTVVPERVGGLWNIPGSYFYVHRQGWARFLPVSFRVRKAVFGIRKAARKKEVFHLWCHPFNIASDPDGLVNGLEEIFKEVARLRSKGELEQMTMSRLADTLSST